jgi:Flp pilus assembly protein TadD
MAEHSPEQDRFQGPGALSGSEGAPVDVFEPVTTQDRSPLARAFRKFREGRGRETISLYQDIVKPRQTPMMAHISRGVKYEGTGQHALAIDEFLAAAELEPDNVEVLACLAAALGALGRFVEADRAMDRALFLDPLSVQARVGEAILLFRQGLYSAAEEQLKGLCERNPSHGPAHFYRGEALNRLGRVDEALVAMEQTIQLQPRNWRAYHTLGMLFDRKADRERASEMYRLAGELKSL